MNLAVTPSNRWCVAEYDAKPTAAKLRQQILHERNVERGFLTLAAPLPAYDDVAMKVVGNEKQIVVAAAFFNSVRHLGAEARATKDEFEILFDPRNDRVGWVQFYFGVAYKAGENPDNPHRDRPSNDAVQVASHLPYPEAHQSDCFEIKLRQWDTSEDVFSPCPITQMSCRWLFAWFSTTEVFRSGGACGFNVARNRPYLGEFSSFNYCQGNGSQDATSLGRLYRFEAPVGMHDVRATLEGRTMCLDGRVSGHSGELTAELASPTDERIAVTMQVQGDVWRATAEIGTPIGGRYRLYVKCGGRPVEPAYTAIDIPCARRAAAFRLSVTYDSPDNLIANYYTPERLDREMQLWAELGVKRINWIEYGDWPSFWGKAVYDWQENYRKTTEACGDYLTAGAAAAHARGLEFIADFKTFDLGFNSAFTEPDGRSTVLDIENRHTVLIPEIAAHQEWTMRANPAWQREAAKPITRLRLYSEREIPTLRRSDVRVLVSGDNRRYRPYRGKVRFTQGVVRRPHQRWTPAGLETIAGAQKNWYVELSGLAITEPFAAVQLGKGNVALTHKAFMIAEAFDASGQAAAWTIATNGDSRGGFFFWKGWQGWNNQTEALLQRRTWNGREVGMTFRAMPNMPTLLEPGFEGARGIWLARMRTMLDAGADGVDIRTYCHHNGPMHYLIYAFAQPVRDTFMNLYGREPRTTPEDYGRIRRIRGDFYTQFLRDARKLTAKRGKKLVVELESGIEVGPEHDCRMQLHLDWRRWLDEGLVDELRMKWWTPESSFVHEQVLPRARRAGVPVEMISRCLHTGLDLRATEMARRVIGGAAAAGFSGYNFYEQQNLMDMNGEGVSTLKGPVREYFAAANEALRTLGM